MFFRKLWFCLEESCACGIAPLSPLAQTKLRGLSPRQTLVGKVSANVCG
jgi:hypothetical protein